MMVTNYMGNACFPNETESSGSWESGNIYKRITTDYSSHRPVDTPRHLGRGVRSVLTQACRHTQTPG